MSYKFIICFILICSSFSLKAQTSYGLSIDEKVGIRKNRVGTSLFFLSKKRNKFGVTVNYNYATYQYPEGVTYLSNDGSQYLIFDNYPPYKYNLGANLRSVVQGLSYELMFSLRMKTLKRSNFDLRFTTGYCSFLDTYRSVGIDGSPLKGRYIYRPFSCNMYFTYLTWYKNYGFEFLFGPAYYFPKFRGTVYLPSNPFVAAELELGISFYYQKRKNQR